MDLIPHPSQEKERWAWSACKSGFDRLAALSRFTQHLEKVHSSLYVYPLEQGVKRPRRLRLNRCAPDPRGYSLNAGGY
jgi:hypothetical protein